MIPQRNPVLAALKISPVTPVREALAAIVRWISDAVTALEPVFSLGTNRLQGFSIPTPISTNDGQVYAWSAAQRCFVFADTAGGSTGVTPGTYGDSTHVGQFTVNASGDLTFAQNVAIAFPGTSGASGGPTGSSTVVPVITYVNGLLTVVTTAAIAGTVPDGTVLNQILRWDGSAWADYIPPDAWYMPPTAGSLNIEEDFESTSLNGAWSLDSGTVAGTVNSLTAVGVNGRTLLDLTSKRSYLQLQSDANTSAMRGITRTISLGTNSTVMWRVAAAQRINGLTANDGVIRMELGDSSSVTPTNFVRVDTNSPASSSVQTVLSVQSGAGTKTVQMTPSASAVATYRTDTIFALVKRSTAFQLYISQGGGWAPVTGTVTQTTAMTVLALRQRNSVTGAEDLVCGFDWLYVDNANAAVFGG